MKNQPCACHVHLSIESGMEKTRIPCLGHGEGCPCTEKQKQEAEKPAENPSEMSEEAK